MYVCSIFDLFTSFFLFPQHPHPERFDTFGAQQPDDIIKLSSLIIGCCGGAFSTVLLVVFDSS